MQEPVFMYDSGTITARLARTHKTLVQGVRFSIKQGESLALIGETGSGKTMIALSLMQLLPSNVQMKGGSIRFLNQETLEVRRMRKLLGTDIVYIPQNGLEFLNPSKKICHHLYDSLKKNGVPGKQLKQTALKKLTAVGFEAPEQVMDQYPFQLSGGMAQRVTIALAHCAQPSLVIADEPTNGLDYAARLHFMQMLDELFPDAARLVITHDIAVAQMCTKTLVLCGGKMMETGASLTILQNPRHPYTRALKDALVQNGMKETPVLRGESGDCPFIRRCPQGKENCMCAHHKDADREWWCCMEQ